MRRLLLQIAPVLHLTRVTAAFAGVANVWFVILWTRAAPQELAHAPAALRTVPEWVLLAGGTANALGLFAYAVALNDVLDVRRDRAMHPERPLPSGRLSLDAAMSLVVGTLMVAIIGATALGISAVLLTVAVAIAILFFNAAGKFVPAVGLVVLGLIYAGHMVVPNLNLRFVWPVWLVMTHALIVAGLSHVLSRKVPQISRRALVTAVVGWLFWSVTMFTFAWWRSGGSAGDGTVWPAWIPDGAATGPLVLAVVFAVLAYLRVRQFGAGPRAAEKITRYGTLWLALYAVAWLAGAWASDGPDSDAFGRATLILSALTLAGFLGMTVLREFYALLEQPLGYRR